MFSKGSTNNMGRHYFLVKTNIWGNQKEFLTVSFYKDLTKSFNGENFTLYTCI